MYKGINEALPFHPEFSWLIVPFSVILDDFNFKWSFPKLPVIANKHTLMKMCVCARHGGGGMSDDTCSLPVWLVEVHSVCVRRGASLLTCNVDLMRRRSLSGRHV